MDNGCKITVEIKGGETWIIIKKAKKIRALSQV